MSTDQGRKFIGVRRINDVRRRAFACPYCGEPTYAKAIVCPHCGHDLVPVCAWCGAALARWQVDWCQACAKKEKRKREWMIALIALIVLLSMVGWLIEQYGQQ